MNYSALADAQRNNNEFLLDLEVRLSAGTEATRETLLEDLATLRALSVDEQDKRKTKEKALLTATKTARKEMLKKLRTDLIKSDMGLHWARAATQESLVRSQTKNPKLIQSEVARIQGELYMEHDLALTRLDDLLALHERLLDAVVTLRAAGRENLEYFEECWLVRLFKDVEGLDREKIKAIGDDLQELGKRLEPYGKRVLEDLQKDVR